MAPRALALSGVAVVVAWFLAALPQVGWAADQLAFRMTDAKITTPTGLARDLQGSVYWTANRTSDQGRVYAVDDAGDTVGTLDFRADPTDVEALAYGDGRLYVGDIGDVDQKRTQITVYVLSNPSPNGRTVTYNAYDFAYPDGPHDAATLLLDASGRLLVVTREAEGGIYAADQILSTSGVNQLERVTDAPSWVTDGTVLADGTIALRTYVSLLLLDPTSYDTTGSAPTPYQKRGESITQPLAGDGLLLGTVGKRSRVLLVPAPTAVATVPDAGPNPPSSSSTPSATAAPETETGPVAEEDTGARGTLMAVGLAALLAVAAGVVVGLARGRGTPPSP